MKVRRSMKCEVSTERIEGKGCRRSRFEKLAGAGWIAVGGSVGIRERSTYVVRYGWGRPWTTARWLGRLIICCQ